LPKRKSIEKKQQHIQSNADSEDEEEKQAKRSKCKGKTDQTNDIRSKILNNKSRGKKKKNAERHE